MSVSPYASATEVKLDEIIRLAEARLSAQLTLGVAADQRAMNFASFTSAVDGVAIAALVSLRADHQFHWSLIILVAGFAVAAGAAIFAAQPVAWDISGSRPGLWLDDILEQDTLHNGRAAMAGFYDEMILDNDVVLKGNADLLRVALWAVVSTLIIAGVVAVLFG
jgi:hypothetical protein